MKPVLGKDDSSERICLNCETTLVGKFCHACGQDGSRKRLVARELASGFFGSLMSLDSRYARTFGGLVRSPGTVARKYAEGRRRSYSNPVAYFVAAITINLLVPLMLSFWLVNDQAASVWLTSSVAAPLGLTLFLPVAGLWTWLFKNSGRNLAENYVFVLYLFGQLLLYEAILVPTWPLLRENLSLAVLGLILAGMFVYGGAQFYALKIHVVAVKFGISLLIVCALLLIVGIALEVFAPGVLAKSSDSKTHSMVIESASPANYSAAHATVNDDRP